MNGDHCIPSCPPSSSIRYHPCIMYHNFAAYMSPAIATYTLDGNVDPQHPLDFDLAMTNGDPQVYDEKRGYATHLGPPQFLAQPTNGNHVHPQLAHSPLPPTSAPSSAMIYTTPLPASTPPLLHPQHTGPPVAELPSMQYPTSVPTQSQAPPHAYYEATSTPAPPMHLTLPQHRPPPMSLTMPITPTYDESGQFVSPQYAHPHSGTPGQISPYQPSPLSADPHSASSTHMTDYFPPYQSTPIAPAHSYLAPTPTHPTHHLPLVSPSLHYGHYGAQPKASGSRSNNAKTGRQQFSACGACRHRRVKCDLREKQEKLQKENTSSEEAKAESKKRPRKAICSNCEERGIACMYVVCYGWHVSVALMSVTSMLR